jgi:hypothetical protein
MENTNSTNSTNISQSKNTNLYNYIIYNLPQIVKIFFLIGFQKNNFTIYHPTNHLNKYIENNKNKIYKFHKYPMITKHKN